MLRKRKKHMARDASDADEAKRWPKQLPQKLKDPIIARP